MAIDGTILIIVVTNQLLDAIIVARLAILLNGAGLTQMPILLVPKVRLMATKANYVAFKAVVMAMVRVMGRPMVKPMLWMVMSWIILRGISQGHLINRPSVHWAQEY